MSADQVRVQPSAERETTAIEGEATDGRAEHEGQFHAYASSHIPWWVRAMWVCYWIGAIYFVTQHLLPMVDAYF